MALLVLQYIKEISMSNNKLQSLSEIFNQRVFRIPDFQRGYSWRNQQLSDFWDDLCNLPDNKSHYTGLLTVEEINNKKASQNPNWQQDLWLFEGGFKAYYLIDGQQRLTTSIILIHTILSTLKDGDSIAFNDKKSWQQKFLFRSPNGNYNSYIFGYEKDNPSDEYFKTKILNQYSSESDKVPEDTLYTLNLKNAKDFFSDKIKQLSKEQIESLFKKIINKFQFNFYEIDNELDTFVAFETMNNRGKPLSHLELLKNRLIYLSTLLKNQEQNDIDNLRKDINNAWKTIYEYLGKNTSSKLNDDDFLKVHWIIYFKYNRKEADSYAKFLLNEHFTTKQVLENKISLTDIQEYAHSLQELVKHWFYLHNPELSRFDNEIKEWLFKLNRIGMRAFAPLLTVALYKDQNNQDNQDLLALLKASERFIFLVFLITKRQSNTENTNIFYFANQYYKNKQNISEIIEKIKLWTDGVQDDKYQGWTDIGRFIENINDHKNNGYYDWLGLRYFLYEYELHLQQEAKGNTKVTWKEFFERKKDETIEHIYPQTADDIYWQDRFNQYDKKQQKALLHNLGNLVLLSRSKNSSLQNKDFDSKKQNGEIGFLNGSYSEIEVAKYQEWNAKNIKERAIKMINFMDKRWGIQFKSYWQKELVDIIGLDFLDDKE